MRAAHHVEVLELEGVVQEEGEAAEGGGVEVAIAEAQAPHRRQRQRLKQVHHARAREVVAAQVQHRQLHSSPVRPSAYHGEPTTPDPMWAHRTLRPTPVVCSSVLDSQAPHFPAAARKTVGCSSGA